MSQNIRENLKDLQKLFDQVSATNNSGRDFELSEALEAAAKVILAQSRSKGSLFFIGNGASASIASHMAVDFWKNAGIKANAFNDSVQLTCLSNDYGYEQVFSRALEMFACAGDILAAISSSGSSKNILKAAQAAKNKGMKLITFSGFSPDNPLRRMGDVNFYVPASEYGSVEVVHHGLCHCLVDAISKRPQQPEFIDYGQVQNRQP